MRIILLHGLFMHRLIMAPMAKRLQKLGWQVENLSYPSTSTDKRRLFNTFDKIIKDGPVLMIGHSLGGLVIKNYLITRQVPAEKVPLVITLGTPHQGAEIAKDMDKFNIQKLLGSSVQFGLLPENLKASWHLPQKLISIAGNVKLGARPLLDRVWRDGVEESDGTVSIAETKVDGMHEHIIVRQTHTSMVYSKSVVQLIDKYATQVKEGSVLK
ncbi:triacylglycerol lipase [Thalassomonas sp. M1454]|uniref:PGAP1-like alpha/beta domain-containing protein n=1 Tax=Thalassomonas sp. M1454 TaxID=2594477 RepID=UPI00117D949A|nr:triacylglycerol lipase [Thalassomonas sp. M1454]TRX54060.1 triacylglycerol lipase [Thalassomonas sp. M1454]